MALLGPNTQGRGHVSGKYALMLDGDMTGQILSVEGGLATADVVVEKLGSMMIQQKHLGPCKYEDISVTCGPGMSKNFYNWIQASLDHKSLQQGRKDGSVISADYDLNAISELSFHHAQISEFGMPALDASAKDAAKMTIKFSPEYTRMKGASGTIKTNLKSNIVKKWLPSNFRVRIDGLDEACKKINKVEALVVKQKIVDDPAGEQRDYFKLAAHVEFPNLVLTVAENAADSIYKWHEEFVIGKGNCTEDKEKGGTIEYLTSDLKETLFTLTFSNLGIFKITPDKVEAASEQVRRVKVEMYCEQIKFAYGGGSTWY